MFSIASANSFASTPVSATAIARMPAIGAESHGADEDECPDELIEAAQTIENPPRQEAEHARGTTLRAPRNPSGTREHHRQAWSRDSAIATVSPIDRHSSA